ncbi:Bifunctional coenzyme A synthase, partial [Dissostichus eleginoides]
ASTSHTNTGKPLMMDSACQTAEPAYCSYTALLEHSSKFTSKYSASAIFNIHPMKRPPKRPRVDPEEEYEDPFEGSSSIDRTALNGRLKE